MAFFFRGLAAGLILVLCIFSAFAFFQLQEMRYNQDALAQDHKLLAAAQSHAAKRDAEYAKEVSSQIESLSAQIDDTASKITSLETEIKPLQSRSKDTDAAVLEQKKRISDLTRRVDAVAGTLLEETVLSHTLRHHEPRPFSYFKSPEWQHQLSVFKSQIARSGGHIPTAIDLAGGEDTFIYKKKGEMHIDGVFHKSIETFKADNEEINIFFVKAPGLNDLENGRLTIVGDKGLDRVLLDGCLAWSEEEGKEDEFTLWRATDTEQRSRTLRITKGLATQIQPTCDNRYLKVHSYPIIRSRLQGENLFKNRPSSPHISKSPLQLQELKTAPFGGIGISFTTPEQGIIPDRGLLIDNVMPEKPASRGGIQRHDTIIKVDGQSLAGMPMSHALEKIRGPAGTSVTITFIREGQPQEKEVTLVREELQLPAFMLEGHQGHGRQKSHLAWDNPGPHDTRFVMTPQTRQQGDDVKAFRIKNRGPTAAKPLDLRITKSKRAGTSGEIHPEWEILPETNCLTQPIAAGEMCHVFVRAKPEIDGQFQGYVVFNDGESEHALTVSGYAVGIAGKLPPNVIGNGSACPAEGTAAEIAISSTEPIRSNSGYFSLPQGKHRAPDDRKQFKVFTAECQAWKNHRNKNTNTFHCNNPGQGVHTATLREYRGDSLDGDWKLEREKERYITAIITCRDGVIDWINWTW